MSAATIWASTGSPASPSWLSADALETHRIRRDINASPCPRRGPRCAMVELYVKPHSRSFRRACFADHDDETRAPLYFSAYGAKLVHATGGSPMSLPNAACVTE